MQPGVGVPPGSSAATRRTAAPPRPAHPAPAFRTSWRGQGPPWPAWLGAMLRRLREREEFLDRGPRERRDARLPDHDVRVLARMPP
jgi:hypothetical protein